MNQTSSVSKFPSQTVNQSMNGKKKKKSTFQMLPNQISFQNHNLKAQKFLPIFRNQTKQPLIVDKQTNPNPNPNPNQNKNQSKSI